MRRLLESCLDTRRKIEKIGERIEELNSRACSINVPLSDMPRGGERKGGADEYVIRKEELEKYKKHLEEKLDNQWKEAGKYIDSEKVGEMLKYRFYDGLSWKDSAKIIGWNENKCFRLYRKVISQKITKNT